MDWRTQLRRNEFRSKIVIVSFIILYLLLGFLIDLFIATGKPYVSSYGQVAYLTTNQAVHAFFTGQLIPYATIITGIIAVISLLVTYSMHDKLMLLGTEYHEIQDGHFKSLEEQQLYNVVEEMKVAAGLKYMPKVYLIEADYMNAFASGYSERSAMVAITRGLLTKLTRDELQAVMAHELSHIRHHDIKLTLMASVLSNLMLMVIDILFYSVLFSRDRREDNRLATVIIILRFVLPIVTALLMLYLSRTREYMADAGCVELTRNNEPLARALLKIHGDHGAHQEAYAQAYGSTAHEGVRRAAYLYDPSQAGIATTSSLNSLFSTHPPIEARLKALRYRV